MSTDPPHQFTAKEAVSHSNQHRLLVSCTHLCFCLAVVKPTEVPTEPPTPPPPATVPPALDGKDTWVPQLSQRRNCHLSRRPSISCHDTCGHGSCVPAAVCRGAKADLVFLIDGSWSIGDDSFSKVIQFVTSMTGAFDVISPKGMQVSSSNPVLLQNTCQLLQTSR